VGNLADFGVNLASLVELQAKLAATELKDCARRAAVSVALVVSAVALTLGSLPVAMLGVAEWLASAQGFSRVGSLLVTAGGVIGIAVVLAVVGIRTILRLECFQSSREEFTRNVAWVKTVLAHSGRVAPRRSH